MAERGGEWRGSQLQQQLTVTTRTARATDQLRFVADLGGLAASATDRHELLQGFAHLAIERLGELAVIDLMNDSGTVERTLVTAHDLGPSDAPPQVEADRLGSSAPRNSTVPSRRARILKPGGSQRDHIRGANGSQPPRAHPVRSILTGPVTVRGRVIGSVTVASRNPHAFLADDVPFWEEVGRRLGLALDTVGAHSQHKQVVDVLQRALLPLGMPDVARFTCAARYEPAENAANIGGDWWDAFVVDDELVITVGDVVGHDLAAAAAMGWLRHAARAYSVEHADIAVVLEQLSSYAARHEATAYATAVLAFADPSSGMLRYCCAGHPPPLLLRGRTARFLTGARNPPLGVTGRTPAVGHVILRPGDAVLFYTDGLYERRGTPIDDRLAQLAAGAATAAGSAPQQLCDQLITAMTSGAETVDDIAMVVVRRTSA